MSEASGTPLKLYWWSVLVGVLIAIAYIGNSVAATGSDTALYHYSTAVGAAVEYAVLLGLALLIARRRSDLLALRRPPSWLTALGLALLVFVVAYVAIFAMDSVLHGGREQGLVPKRWEPKHESAYAANWVVVAAVAPFVEELIYRGLGYSLIVERFGKWIAIVAVGLLFAASHGLVQAFPELATLGCGLAWLRSKTESILPGMLVHAAFNSVALAVVFF